VQRIVRQCDVLVCPSHSEGMPTVILEAMASGLAIIATNVGAVKEQIKGNGWLLESISSEKLTEALIECCQCEETQLSDFKKASIKLVSEKFLWNKTIELMLKQFSKILKKTT
ncbi:glycosyltransferase family 4 protein, partial [bacterium]|nr:glycosyltransferase family 4 protein [bacterium]